MTLRDELMKMVEAAAKVRDALAALEACDPRSEDQVRGCCDRLQAAVSWMRLKTDERCILAMARVVLAAKGFCEEMRYQGHAKGPLPGEYDDLEDAITALEKVP